MNSPVKISGQFLQQKNSFLGLLKSPSQAELSDEQPFFDIARALPSLTATLEHPLWQLQTMGPYAPSKLKAPEPP